MYKKEKRGQVTIFIIIAIVIVGVAVLIYFLIPKAETTAAFDEKNPNAFIQTCLEDKIEDTVETISLQGGSLSPGHYFTYNNINIQYLCYTNEYQDKCKNQNPLLKQNIESEIENEIVGDVVNCFNKLKQSYEEKNYNVQMETGKTSVELLPKKIVTSFDYIVTISKSQTERYDSFKVVLDNNLYELISIANSITDHEATNDNQLKITWYLGLYDNLGIDRNVREDGTHIYVLTDKTVGGKFQFALRSKVPYVFH